MKAAYGIIGVGLVSMLGTAYANPVCPANKPYIASLTIQAKNPENAQSPKMANLSVIDCKEQGNLIMTAYVGQFNQPKGLQNISTTLESIAESMYVNGKIHSVTETKGFGRDAVNQALDRQIADYLDRWGEGLNKAILKGEVTYSVGIDRMIGEGRVNGVAVSFEAKPADTVEVLGAGVRAMSLKISLAGDDVERRQYDLPVSILDANFDKDTSLSEEVQRLINTAKETLASRAAITLERLERK